MARTARPWFRKQTGWWMVSLGGKQQKLAEGRDNKKAALKRYHELQLLVAEAPDSADMRVASVCDAFLQWGFPVALDLGCFDGLPGCHRLARFRASVASKTVNDEPEPSSLST
jgi:hypothetical protein